MTKPDGTGQNSALENILTGLAKIGLAMKNSAWREADRRGLSPTQRQVLSLLRVRPGVGLSEVARHLAVTPATVSASVATVVRKALVRKARSSCDARAVSLKLTAAGRREADRAAAWPDLLLGAANALSPIEQGAFLRGIVKMIRTLQERGEIPVSRMCVTCEYFRPNIHPNRKRPHHCAFVDAPFGDPDLRLECPDHQTAGPQESIRLWEAFACGSG